MPLVLDGSYDHSCSMEIAVKDMELTVALADELGVALIVGRLIEERYRSAERIYEQYDNHLQVIEMIEKQRGLSLQVQGYISPSKYGANPKQPPDTQFITDEIGRIKPDRRHVFPSDTAKLNDCQRNYLSALFRDLAVINQLILDEGYDLGRGMDLTDDLIKDVITWSVGASFWSDQPMHNTGLAKTVQQKGLTELSANAPLLGQLLFNQNTMEV